MDQDGYKNIGDTLDNPSFLQALKYWQEWFSYKRMDIACKCYVRGLWAYWFIRIAKECGAIKGIFKADGSVMVIFSNMPKRTN